MSKIGIDIGTSNIKAVLFDEAYKVIKKVNVEVPSAIDQYGHYEQNVDAVVEAVNVCIEELNNKSVTNISFSSAMHSLILAVEENVPFTQNMIWADARADQDIRIFKETEDWLSFYQKTGTPIHPMSPFAKLLYYRNADFLKPGIHIMGIKEYIIFLLTGEYVMDYSIASATGLMNIHTLKWDQDILDFLDIDETYLPRLVDTNTKFKALNYDFSVTVGASDGCLVNFGNNALNKGQTTLTLGTSGAVRMTVKKPVLDPLGRTFCYYLKKGIYVIGGAVNNGGNTLDWVSELFYDNPKKFYKDLPSLIDKVEPGSEGLVFLPHINGERAPYWDNIVSGQFFGLKHYHKREHMIRAVVEGILFNLKHVLSILEENGGRSKEIYLSGGVFEIPGIRQMVADIFEEKVYIQKEFDASILGAVLLTDKKKQEVSDLDAYYPGNSELYRDSFEVFLMLSFDIMRSLIMPIGHDQFDETEIDKKYN